MGVKFSSKIISNQLHVIGFNFWSSFEIWHSFYLKMHFSCLNRRKRIKWLWSFSVICIFKHFVNHSKSILFSVSYTKFYFLQDRLTKFVGQSFLNYKFSLFLRKVQNCDFSYLDVWNFWITKCYVWDMKNILFSLLNETFFKKLYCQMA
jgi:hypothetical protein